MQWIWAFYVPKAAGLLSPLQEQRLESQSPKPDFPVPNRCASSVPPMLENQ
ncbi:hypothetical protein SynBOUM118_01222 [Synechococcus sp. BOUM118]|nr:hypothetical protein SynBOUM118_01222 [Synechococcus sp. BOUM118]